MSATLDAAPIAAYLGDARVLRSEGRQYPLTIDYTPHSAAPLEDQVAAALERLSPPALDGHVLVFLPGAAEIRRAQTACAASAQPPGWLLLPLHGDQPPEEQDRAVAPSRRRKIILSTNVAESSITIDGVTAVIDSGLARIAGHSPWSGLPTLRSGASARRRPISARDAPDEPRPAAPSGSIRSTISSAGPPTTCPKSRAPISRPRCCCLRAMGGSGSWIGSTRRPPRRRARRRPPAPTARAPRRSPAKMARYPLHPRLARLIIEARRQGVAEDGCTVAALLSAGERLPDAPTTPPAPTCSC